MTCHKETKCLPLSGTQHKHEVRSVARDINQWLRIRIDCSSPPDSHVVAALYAFDVPAIHRSRYDR